MSTGPQDPIARILTEAELNRRQERAASAAVGSVSIPVASGGNTASDTGGVPVMTDAQGKIPSELIYPGAGDAGEPTYEHVQATPAATWTINHPLAGARPTVVVTDAEGREVQTAVEYPGPSTVVVRFGRPTAGTAHLSL